MGVLGLIITMLAMISLIASFRVGSLPGIPLNALMAALGLLFIRQAIYSRYQTIIVPPPLKVTDSSQSTPEPAHAELPQEQQAKSNTWAFWVILVYPIPIILCGMIYWVISRDSQQTAAIAEEQKSAIQKLEQVGAVITDITLSPGHPPNPKVVRLNRDEFNEFMSAQQYGTMSFREFSDDDIRLTTLFPTVEEFAVASAEITNASLPLLKHHRHLQRLSLNCPQLTDIGLAELPELPKLSFLSLSQTRLTTVDVLRLSQRPMLKTLELQNTALTDEGLSALAQLQQLKILRLDNTLITDAGLKHLVELKNLRLLTVHDTGVTRTGANSLKSKLRGCDIIVSWPEDGFIDISEEGYLRDYRNIELADP